MKHSGRIAFCGMLAALGLVIMFLSGVIPVATIALPALAGCILIPVTAEIGVKWGLGVYAVTGILGFFIVGDREALLIYLLFFGYYPVLYAVLDRIKNKPLRYIVKLLIFNAAAIADYLIVSFIFGIPIESIEILGAYTPVVVLLLANVVFIVFDFALKGLIQTYFVRLHKTASRFLQKR